MAQQGVDGWLAAAEIDEQFHGFAGTALFQDAAEELLPVSRSKMPRLLEVGEGVGGQHFRPFVAVIARRVTAGEDMGEAVRRSG